MRVCVLRVSSTYTASTRNVPPFPTLPTFSRFKRIFGDETPPLGAISSDRRGEKRRIARRRLYHRVSDQSRFPSLSLALRASLFSPVALVATRQRCEEDSVSLFESPFLASRASGALASLRGFTADNSDVTAPLSVSLEQPHGQCSLFLYIRAFHRALGSRPAYTRFPSMRAPAGGGCPSRSLTSGQRCDQMENMLFFSFLLSFFANARRTGRTAMMTGHTLSALG